MRKVLLLCILIFGLTVPVYAGDFTAPDPPDHAQSLLPEDRDTFGEGLWYVITSAVATLQPQLLQSGKIAFSVIGITMLMGMLTSCNGAGKEATALAGIVAVACLLLQPADAQIEAAAETIQHLSQYGKLLLPVMTAALAAQGGAVTSAGLYAATVTFDALLSAVISSVLVPMVYVYLVLSVVYASLGDGMLKRLRDLMKSIMTWCLKIMLYIFTAYIAVTGVVGGTTDQAAIKAAKLTISWMVPVVGGILSDASEAVLVSAAVVKNAAGIAGMLAVIAIVVVPFLQIGLQYLTLKLTAAICALFANARLTGLVEDFSGAMGFLLGMTGAMSLMLLISLMCFLKGVG